MLFVASSLFVFTLHLCQIRDCKGTAPERGGAAACEALRFECGISMQGCHILQMSFGNLGSKERAKRQVLPLSNFAVIY